MPVLTWDEIEPAAERAFSISMSENELHWARQAWQILSDAGLAEYQGSLAWHRVVIRFLALAGIYSDWCDVAWGQGYSDPQYADWIEDLDISAFHIGQLVGAEQNDEDDEVDDSILVQGALTRLANDARSEVFRALRDHFGNASGLFLSFWRSQASPDQRDAESPGEADDEDDWDENEFEDEQNSETDDKILNDETEEKLEAFAWIDQGCPPYR